MGRLVAGHDRREYFSRMDGLPKEDIKGVQPQPMGLTPEGRDTLDEALTEDSVAMYRDRHLWDALLELLTPERPWGSGKIGPLRVAGVVLLGIIHAIDLLVFGALAIWLIVPLWLNEWEVSPILAVLAVISGFWSLKKRVRRLRDSRRRAGDFD